MKKLSTRGKVTIVWGLLFLMFIIVLGIIETHYPTVDLQVREELKWITDLT